MQLRWAGHVTRMEDVRMPKAVFFNKLQEGKRDRGAPRKHYKDQLKRPRARAGIGHQSWQQEASDRDIFDAERHKTAKEKHRRQKERAASLPSSPQTFVCPKCGRGCDQESVSTATNEHARTDHQPSQQSSSARIEPSNYIYAESGVRSSQDETKFSNYR